mmetsp:Transcript_4948/g.7298  ORF Transcript_4948/g.7298 Transcript_4948/m.7298 type:complete len:334 (+) Transcript_4948:148-1149(+)
MTSLLFVFAAILFLTVYSCAAFIAPFKGQNRQQSRYSNTDSFSSVASSKQSLNVDTRRNAGLDMNTYNIPYEEAIEQWTAEVCPETVLRDEGIYLGARDKKNIMAAIDHFLVNRTAAPSGGLGLELLEIAGGREDGIGITIVAGLLPGGNAQTSGILPGDSIVSLEVMDPEKKKFFEPIGTECLGYDKTVEAIIEQLPPNWELIKVTVKRLRRKPKVRVELQFPPSQGDPVEFIELFAGENLRRAMLVRGVKLNDDLSKRFDNGGSGNCGADGTCATCVVSVLEGAHLLSPQGLQEQQMLQKNPRWRMACKAIVGYGQQEGTLKLIVNPRQWN